jgi:hypothetical protein
VQRLRPSANGLSAPEQVPARVLVLDFSGGRHLGLVKAGGIDVLPGEAGSAKGERAFTRSLSSRPKRCQKVRAAKRERSRKKLLRSPRAARKRSAAASRPEAGNVPSSTMLLEAG